MNGHFTLSVPACGTDADLADLASQWDADAICSPDPVQLPDIKAETLTAVSISQLSGGYGKQHPEYRQHVYLQTEPVTALGKTLDIPIMDGFSARQFEPDAGVDLRKLWQVCDRTAGDVTGDFTYSEGVVTVRGVTPFHRYTVSFLAWTLCDPLRMEEPAPLDFRYPEAQRHAVDKLDEWLTGHPDSPSILVNGLGYPSGRVCDGQDRVRYADPCDCLGAVSPLALKQMEREHRRCVMTPEDFTRAGRRHPAGAVPSRKRLEWLDFVEQSASSFARQCVDLLHRRGRTAAFNAGEGRTGIELYGKSFPDIGFDAAVGVASDGLSIRRLADAPVAKTEAWLAPPFDMSAWTRCLRALLRAPVQRLGCCLPPAGEPIPEGIIGQVREAAERFREILRYTRGTAPYTAPLRVAVLTAWGSLRAWQAPRSQWDFLYRDILEALAGFPVQASFLSFEEIRAGGVPQGVDVLLNAGRAYSAWSGGENWADPAVCASIRAWVYSGGGFIGVGDPTACRRQGDFFQLPDVLGVQKEIGVEGGRVNLPFVPVERHFITADAEGEPDYGAVTGTVYPVADSTVVLDAAGENCRLAVNHCGRGRSVYMAGAPFNRRSVRVLLRGLFWAASRETELFRWFSANPWVEVFAFPEAERFCALNLSDQPQETVLTLDDAAGARETRLDPFQVQWLRLER